MQPFRAHRYFLKVAQAAIGDGGGTHFNLKRFDHTVLLEQRIRRVFRSSACSARRKLFRGLRLHLVESDH
jgi:hypothetical protein